LGSVVNSAIATRKEPLVAHAHNIHFLILAAGWCGVPFYSRPDEWPYSKLVALNAAVARVNYLGTIKHFNGIPTFK